MAMLCPVTVTNGAGGRAFLQAKECQVGNLKDLPIYYIGYDTLWGYEGEDGDRWGEQKVGSVYYLYINDKIVLCEYSSSAKEPKEVIDSGIRLCYVQSLHDNPVMYELQHLIAEETREAENPIMIKDFSSKVLHVMSLDEVLYKEGKIIVILLATLILLKEWLKCLQQTISIRLCRSIRWAVKQYGKLPKIYEEIAAEENVILSDNILLTKNWLVHGKAKEIIYCDDIVWIYHKLNILPLESSRTYIYTKDRKKHLIYNWSVRNIYQLYDMMKERHPEIIGGYSKEMKKTWRLGIKYFMEKYGRRKRK